jgi:endonuclease III
VKNTNACAKKLRSLLEGLETPQTPEFPDSSDPIATLILSFFMWESTTERAIACYDRLRSHTVSFNDLRVSMPHEMVEWLEDDDALNLERAQRLRAVLRNVFLREHAVSLDALNDYGKREVRKYIDSLEGIVPYVASRVMLVCFETHAVPVDGQLREMLIEQGAADESAGVAELSAWMARQIRADESRDAHHKLQAWVDRAASSRPRGGRRGKSNASRSKKKVAGG